MSDLLGRFDSQPRADGVSALTLRKPSDYIVSLNYGSA